MATATMTPATANYPIKALHEGVNVVYGSLSTTVTGAAGLLLCKLPHGATVIDARFWFAGASDVRVGTSASPKAIMGTASGGPSYRAFNNTSDGALYTLSLSDAAPQRWEYIKAVATDSFSGVQNFMLMYTMEQAK